MKLKDLLVESLPQELQKYESMISECGDIKKGDFTLPCFAMAKEEKKSPMDIANNLSNKLKDIDLFEKVEVVGGYLNIFLNRKIATQYVLEKFAKNGIQNLIDSYGNGKTICIDYSSANLAKYLHIGHLSTTILGECLARLFENAGYKVVRINFVGDYGTPFGKIVAAYKLWGNKQDIETRGVDAIQDLYVQFCKHDGEKEYDDLARDTFKKIEEKEPETTKLYKWIVEISLNYNKKATAQLGVNFNDYNGESYYADKTDYVLDLLSKKGLLQDGEGGSKIVDLGKLGIALIKKSDGSSLYLTHDIMAAIDRKNKYNYYKNYIVTDVAQKLHFEQVFKILELLGFDYAKDCQHIFYGRIRLPEGKISSRIGKQALIKDILNVATENAMEIIKDRNLPNAEEVAKVVGFGATVYTVTKNERIKDTVFDMNEALKFEGETSPYMQYTYARLSSILRKVGDCNGNVDYSYLIDDDSFTLLKMLSKFGEIIKQATEKLEPSIVAKYVMSICGAVNKFYTNQRVITNNADETTTKCKLIAMSKEYIKFGLNLLCIQTVESM